MIIITCNKQFIDDGEASDGDMVSKKRKRKPPIHVHKKEFFCFV